MNELILNEERAALVVIDLQKGIVGMKAAPHDPSSVVQNAARIADAFRQRGLPVFLVRVTPSADRKDSLHPRIDESSTPSQWNRPPDWSEIVPEMNKQESDFVITKRQWGAFHGTELDLQLRRRGIDTIVLCGISTDIGVESTARFAYEYGYHQVFAEDAMTARSATGHAHAVNEIFPRIGMVRKTEDILAALGKRT
jgi:nicotinamidase-related amidase